MKKNFRYTLIDKETRKGIYQQIVTFGSEDKPFPKNWEKDVQAQMALINYKDEFFNKMFVIKIEEGSELTMTKKARHPLHEDYLKDEEIHDLKSIISVLEEKLEEKNKPNPEEMKTKLKSKQKEAVMYLKDTIPIAMNRKQIMKVFEIFGLEYILNEGWVYIDFDKKHNQTPKK